MVEAMKEFDKYIEGVIQDWNVPGAGLAVIKDGAVVYSIGCGFRDMEKKLPITPESIFAIGSTSKAFSAVSIGILVDEGKLEWDKPIRNYIPEFKLFDPIASENLTVRDMLCHRSGLPRHDLAWYHRDISRHDLLKILPYLEPNEGFRNHWQYQNIIYAVTGLLVEAVTGKTWEEFVKERILQPLGMSSTNFSVIASQESDNFCLPYEEQENEVLRTPFANIDAIGPAGSINSTLLDMGKWISMNLNHGKSGNTQIISESSLGQILRPQMPIMEESPLIFSDTDSFNVYGMAWILFHYRGMQVIEHTGGIDGFTTEVYLIPDKNLGIVAFSNMSTGVPMAIAREAIDRIHNFEPIDWSERYKSAFTQALTAARESGKSTERKEGTHPTHPLEEFTGTFQHPGYGTIEFFLNEGNLAAKFRDWTIPLSHVHFNIFDGKVPILGLYLKFTFEIGDEGNIDRVLVPFEATVKPIELTRIPPEEMKRRSFLEPFIGEYELMGQVIKVSLKGENALVVSGPGMSNMELLPYRATQFRLKGMEVVSLDFKKDASGKVVEVVMNQPGAVLTAKRKA